MTFVEAPVGSDLARESVQLELKCSLGPPARRIMIKLDGTRVILHGTADSVALRQSAEAAVRRVPGVTGVSNYIHVNLPH